MLRFIRKHKLLIFLACLLTLCKLMSLTAHPLEQSFQIEKNYSFESKHISQFKDKDKFARDERVREYQELTQELAEQSIVPSRKHEQIREEIERQIELNLPVYVIQPGDRLKDLAMATEQDYEYLLTINGFKNGQVELQVGDLLTGIVRPEQKQSLFEEMIQGIKSIQDKFLDHYELEL